MRSISLPLAAAFVFTCNATLGAEQSIVNTPPETGSTQYQVTVWSPGGRADFAALPGSAVFARAPGKAAARPATPIPMAKPSLPRVQPPREAICGMIEKAARAHEIPVNFLTRLIWQESRFRISAVSHAGARGIAQFMPATAAERDLKDPFDPKQALGAAASLLSSLKRRFGNLGLAAAAYNAGPGRVANWLGKQGQLPEETRDYVEVITGWPASHWAASAQDQAQKPAPKHDLSIVADHTADAGCVATVVAMAE